MGHPEFAALVFLSQNGGSQDKDARDDLEVVWASDTAWVSSGAFTKYSGTEASGEQCCCVIGQQSLDACIVRGDG